MVQKDNKSGIIRRSTLAVLLFIAFAVCMLATTKTAQAAIATGTNGTCSWEIDDDGVLTKYRGQPWYCYVKDLLAETDGAIWRETVAMQSGYGELLSRHWPVAVQEFAKHITSYDTGRDIYSVQRARYYFMSFVRGNTKTGMALKEVLQYLDSYGR